MHSPNPEAPLALDIGKVVLDGDAVEAGAEVQVEAGNAELGREQLLHRDLPQTLDDLLVPRRGQVLGDRAVELPAQLEGVVERVTHPGPWREQGARHQDDAVEQTWN